MNNNQFQSKVYNLDLDFQNGSRSNVHMPIKSYYMTCYLIAIVIFSTSVTISKIFIIEKYMTLIVTLEWTKIKGKYADWKPIHDLLVDGNSNFLCVSHHCKGILCWNVHNLDLDF